MSRGGSVDGELFEMMSGFGELRGRRRERLRCCESVIESALLFRHGELWKTDTLTILPYFLLDSHSSNDRIDDQHSTADLQR